MASDGPARVAVVNDYDVIVEGVAAMLGPHAELVEVVELDANEPLSTQVDIALFDTYAQGEADHDDVQLVIDDPLAECVVMYTWSFDTVLVEAALRRGVAGYLSKTLTGAALARDLARIHAGEQVISAPPSRHQFSAEGRRWPGRELGLSERESEVLALIAQGRTNAEIVALLHLSLNSIKTHTRNLFRKIGVTNRTQAALWGVAHGFLPPEHGGRS